MYCRHSQKWIKPENSDVVYGFINIPLYLQVPSETFFSLFYRHNQMNQILDTLAK